LLIASRHPLVLLACALLLMAPASVVVAGGAKSGSSGISAPAAGGAPVAPDASAQEAPAEQEKPAVSDKPDEVVPPDLEQLLLPVAKTAAELDEVEKQLEGVKDNEGDLAGRRPVLEQLQLAARKASESLRPRLQAVRSQVEKLGPAPAKDAPAEAPEVTNERGRLDSLLARIDGAIKASELSQVRATQLLQRVRELRQTAFAQQLLRRVPHNPLSLTSLRRLRAEWADAAPRIATALQAWSAAARPQAFWLLALVAVAAALYTGLSAFYRRLFWIRIVDRTEATPGFATRASTASVLAVTALLPVAAAIAVVYLGLDALDLFYREVGRILYAGLLAVLGVAAAMSLTRAVLQPRHGAWRLLDVSDQTARRLRRLLVAIVVVYALDRVGRIIISELSLTLPVSIFKVHITSLLLAALLALLALLPFVPMRPAPGAVVSRWRPHWLKVPLLALAAAVGGATMLGYVSLAHFLAKQTVLTGAVLVLAGLAHLAIRAATATTEQGSALDGILGLEKERGRQLMGALRYLLNAVLFLASIPLLMLSLGVPPDEVAAYVRAGLFGFELGQFRISVARLLIAVVLFLGLAFATRLLQRWLTAGVLGPSHMDSGIANSIETGVGYAGIAIAALIAISYAGFDVSNFALVAGALSVGIGFGLQSIVNNFVSGLILLVERPVKVGDWIIIKGLEGYVRRISVRATEIETFDRSSVIVPNSELITGPVTNWTHRNALGRVTVRVRVAYSADPDHVIAALGEVAKANSAILQYPEPLVSLDNLANDALEFSVRVVVPDINRSLGVQTRLRADIVNAFRRAGIPIPHVSLADHLDKAAPSTVDVHVATSLKADPARVLEVLSFAAAGTSAIAREPAPVVTFDEIGRDGFEFTIRATPLAGSDAASAGSALRFAVATALARAGIDIAVGQRDLHIRDLDIVRGFLARAAEERARKAGMGPPPASPAGEK